MHVVNARVLRDIDKRPRQDCFCKMREKFLLRPGIVSVAWRGYGQWCTMMNYGYLIVEKWRSAVGEALTGQKTCGSCQATPTI